MTATSRFNPFETRRDIGSPYADRQIAHKARSGWNNKRRVKKKISETLFYLEIYSCPVERAKNMDAIKMHIALFLLKRCHIYISIYVLRISLMYILIFIVISVLDLNFLLKEFKRISL